MPGKSQRPTHIGAVLPLTDLQEHTQEIKNAAKSKPLSDGQRQTFLHLSLEALRGMGFSDKEIIRHVNGGLQEPEIVKFTPPPTADAKPEPAKQTVGPNEKTVSSLFGKR